MPRNYNEKIMSGKENERPKRVSNPTFKAQECRSLKAPLLQVSLTTGHIL